MDMVFVCVVTMSADMFVILIVSTVEPPLVRCHHATLEQLTISLLRAEEEDASEQLELVQSRGHRHRSQGLVCRQPASKLRSVRM